MGLRLAGPRERALAGAACRVDARTKRLLTRIRPGEVAVIDHEDLDRVAAEGLVARGASAVVNASPSITGRYPNLGPEILLEAGIPLVDAVGPLLLRKVREGTILRIEGDRVYAGDELVGVGVRQDAASVRQAMVEAEARLSGAMDAFARNTLEYMERERDLLFGGVGVPEIGHDLNGRHVLVVVRGPRYREDLAALRAYIRDVKPVLVGVDGGADALLEEGYRPDIVIGDMDSVSERALRAAREVIVHAYRDGRAPGRGRPDTRGRS
ncbi:MAG TPA: putative cytokinetic ring protein SteA, partial [Actinomycetota bacterium]|nr:putative cytokinetic ring protein SteA [Actinomycetota bacterium]